MKKTHKNLKENELENAIDNMVDKTVIEYHQRNKPYTVPHFTGDTVLTEQMQDTDKDATQTPAQDNENLIEETQLQDVRYEVNDKDITETCDTATKFKLFGEFQVFVEKKLSEMEAAIVADCNGQIPPQNISGNSLTSISVINVLKTEFPIYKMNYLKKIQSLIAYQTN